MFLTNTIFRWAQLLWVVLLALPGITLASSGVSDSIFSDFTHHWLGWVCLIIFILAYVLVILEEKLHLRKSKPVLLAAGLIWALIAWQAMGNEQAQVMIEARLRHNFLEYAELFFFLLVAMTYINAMMERGVFDALRGWLVQKGLSYKNIFWLTGFLAFFISHPPPGRSLAG